VLEGAEDVRVLAGVGPVEPVVGAHHRPGTALLDHGLERWVVELLQGPLTTTVLMAAVRPLPAAETSRFNPHPGIVLSYQGFTAC